VDHVDEFPWHWTPSHVEEYFGGLRSIRHLSNSTLRAHRCPQADRSSGTKAEISSDRLRGYHRGR